MVSGRGEHVDAGLVGCRHGLGKDLEMARASERLAGNGQGLDQLQAETDQDAP